MTTTPAVSIERSLGGGARVRGKPTTSAQCWVPPGLEARVGDRWVPGGMIYLGRNLPAIAEWRGVEPALIDPTLPRRDDRPERHGESMGYWPSYAEIPPACRSAFLDWLEGGRADPDAYIGYVFLYFYGLERRALHDVRRLPDARDDLGAIEAEVRRLLARYGENRSFRRYASQLLDFLHAAVRDETASSPPEVAARGSELPLTIRVAVARFARQGTALPPEWALAWAIADPEASLRTPAARCRPEFEELFRRTYRDRFGDGMRLPTCKRTIKAAYRPASASFGAPIELKLDLPDVTALVGPRRKLADLVSECSDALDSFSRWIGRHPDGRESLAAAAMLPPELLEAHAPSEFRRLRDMLDSSLSDREYALLQASEVVGRWLPDDGRRQSKRDAVEASRLLAQAGFGVEPDCRFGGRRLSREDEVVVFRLDASKHETPSPAYSAAALLLHLATMVSAADGEIAPEEEQHMRDHLADGLQLDGAERRRLAAHLRWLLAKPPGMAGVQKRLEALGDAQRRAAGHFLVSIAWADGRVEPEEVRSLTKIFRVLGLDPASVHQWLHDAQAAPADAGPVTIQPSEPGARGFRIPAPADGTAVPGSLDMELVRAKMEETEAVSHLLAGIFIGDDEEPVTVATAPATQDSVKGLDAAHSAFLRRLGERGEWERVDLETVADEMGLMPDGALEMLNEAAFEAFDEPLLEGEDRLVINTSVYEGMLS